MSELTLVQRQISGLALRLDLGFGDDVDPKELQVVLKQTCFKGDVSDAQMTALLVIAKQYNLNPWTKEIYAFPDPRNGIVPIVSVDGWTRIVNEHPQFDGLDFEFHEGEGKLSSSMTCRIYRKDRTKPTVVTEYMAECSRDTQPWKSHPRRMLRHKSLIQCARLAFGFSGIVDPDDGEVISNSAGPVTEVTPHGDRPLTPVRRAPAAAPAPRQADVTDVEPRATTPPPPPAPRPSAPVSAPVSASAQDDTGTNSAGEDTGELASDGQKRNLELKAEAGGWVLTDYLASKGWNIATLTVSQFNTARRELSK